MSRNKSTGGTVSKPSTTPVSAVRDTDLLCVSAFIIVEGNCKYKGLNVRLISEWTDCCSNSKVFGESPEAPWLDYRGKNSTCMVVIPEPELPVVVVPSRKNSVCQTPSSPAPIISTSRTRCATYKWPSFAANLDTTEKKYKFQNNPGIYGILMGTKIGESRETILSFVYQDCSIFAVESGLLAARSQAVYGVLFELNIESGKPLIDVEESSSTSLEPLIINIERLGGYPVLAKETEGDALNSVYVHGVLTLGPWTRMIFIRPLGVSNTHTQTRSVSLSNTHTQSQQVSVSTPAAPHTQLESDEKEKCHEDAAIHQRVSVLPGLADISKFKEDLSTQTFSLQIYREDICDRAFDIRNIEEFRDLQSGDKSTGFGITKSDLFLIKCITDALDDSSKMLAHGSVRFRLEELLTSSVDLLREFEMLRKKKMDSSPSSSSSSPPSSSSFSSSFSSSSSLVENVFIKEEMLLEVRLGIPSKPKKVLRPSDISLRSVLEKARNGNNKNNPNEKGSEINDKNDGIESDNVIEKTADTNTISAVAAPTKQTTTSVSGGNTNTNTNTNKSTQNSKKKTSQELPKITPTPGPSPISTPTPTPTTISNKEAPFSPTESLASLVLGRGEIEINCVGTKARHEQFLESGTRIHMTAELCRRLNHPTDIPKVLSEDLCIEREKRQYSQHFEELDKVIGSLGKSLRITDPPAPGRGTGAGASRGKSSGVKFGIKPTQVSAPESVLGESKYAYGVSDVRAAYVPSIVCSEELSIRLSTTPFTRMVFVFRYEDDDALTAISDAISRVNTRSMPDIQGSLRSYSFTPSELVACAEGKLDVITGIMIIDEDTRIVILEGLAGPGLGMQSVYMEIPRKHGNDSDFKMLCNPEVLFTSRLYPTYGPDIRRIRLREKLKKLARRPEIYNRRLVDEVCFLGVDNLMSIRRAVDLKSAKNLDMFPKTESMNSLELLYGEAVSCSDIDGIEAEKMRQEIKFKSAQFKRDNARLKNAQNRDGASFVSFGGVSNASQGLGVRPDGDGHEDSSSVTFSLSDYTTGIDQSNGRKNRRGVDCRNSEYDEWIRNRAAHRFDRLQEQREIRRQGWNDMLNRKYERERTFADTVTKVFGEGNNKNQKIYLYSTQSLNFKELACEEMRRKNGTETVSEDKNEKKEWLTPKGFRYPALKSKRDIMTHPKKPAESTIEDLKQPWQGDDAPESRSHAHLSPEERSRILRLERGYTTRVKGGVGSTFGSLLPVQFEHPFQLSLVGDKTKLPRGTMTAGMEHDPDGFKSIHLVQSYF